jgi:hypothetical protein
MNYRNSRRYYGPVAQWIEHRASDADVAGSSPAGVPPLYADMPHTEIIGPYRPDVRKDIA